MKGKIAPGAHKPRRNRGADQLDGRLFSGPRIEGPAMAATELNHQQEARWTSLLSLIEVSDGQGAVLDAGGRAEGYTLGLFDAGVITEALRERLARQASVATADKVDRLEREAIE